MNKDEIRKVADRIGGICAMSLKLGLSRAAVSQWKQIPLNRVRDVERLTGVSRHRLRPDVFGTRPSVRAVEEA